MVVSYEEHTVTPSNMGATNNRDFVHILTLPGSQSLVTKGVTMIIACPFNFQVYSFGRGREGIAFAV